LISTVVMFQAQNRAEEQPSCDQPSVTSPPQRVTVISLTQPTSIEARATLKAPLNFVNCYLSQYEEDTDEPSVFAQENNAIICL